MGGHFGGRSGQESLAVGVIVSLCGRGETSSPGLVSRRAPRTGVKMRKLGLCWATEGAAGREN